MASKNLVLQVAGIACTVNAKTAQAAGDEELVTVCTGEEHGNLHAPTKITMERHCETCASKVEYGSLKKASKQGSAYAVVEQTEVKATLDSTLDVTGQMIQTTLHDAAELAAATLPGKDRSTYYLEPTGAPQIGKYSLIVDVLTRHPEVAVCGVYSPRTKPGFYRIGVYARTLVLEPLCWPEDVKAAPVLDIIDPTIEMQTKLDALVAKSVVPFDASEYRNDYRDALVNLMASKTAVEGVTPEKAKSTPAAVGATVDLDSMLDGLLA